MAPASLARKAPQNVNFVGTWTPNTGVAWTITRENLRTGVCAGTSAATGYTLTNCRITANHYRFIVSTGSYHSVNTGTIQGNHLSGVFNDGSSHPYTAVRTKR